MVVQVVWTNRRSLTESQMDGRKLGWQHNPATAYTVRTARRQGRVGVVLAAPPRLKGLVPCGAFC